MPNPPYSSDDYPERKRAADTRVSIIHEISPTSPRSIWPKYVHWPVYLCSCIHGKCPMNPYYPMSSREQQDIINPKNHEQFHTHINRHTEDRRLEHGTSAVAVLAHIKKLHWVALWWSWDMENVGYYSVSLLLFCSLQPSDTHVTLQCLWAYNRFTTPSVIPCLTQSKGFIDWSEVLSDTFIIALTHRAF